MSPGQRVWALQAAVVSALVIAIVGVGHYGQQEIRRHEVEDILQPIAALLEENRNVVESLKRDGLAESESAILDSYMQRIRKDGAPKNSAMKRRIDALVDNNTVIVALLSAYAPRARTRGFRAAADKFRDYASSFRDRWHSVFEIFMAGGNLPRTGPAFPAELAEAVSAEITSAR